MTEQPTDLAELACDDCCAEVVHRRDHGLSDLVLVVTVTHARTCPWLARVAPEGTTLVYPTGILVHAFAEPEPDDAT